ncbi:hypothetical protein BGY98DRAFT_1042221 [Russula aff. rugulosa BPL654]|nr:hypothetical protein BGY98DRAFT_1042221 [Russula aff. rugulosa BPL654]
MNCSSLHMWLQRAATVLNTKDPLIAPCTARILPSVQQMKQRRFLRSAFSEERKDYEPLGESTVDITYTLKCGDFDGAPHFLFPDRCRLNIRIVP